MNPNPDVLEKSKRLIADLLALLTQQAQEIEFHKGQARMMAQAADTEKAESKHWRTKAEAAEALLTHHEAEIARLTGERDEARKDASYHHDCRPNRQQAEAAMADAKAMNDKWADEVAARREAEALLTTARQFIAELADVYTVDTDQVALCRLVQRAKEMGIPAPANDAEDRPTAKPVDLMAALKRSLPASPVAPSEGTE